MPAFAEDHPDALCGSDVRPIVGLFSQKVQQHQSGSHACANTSAGRALNHGWKKELDLFPGRPVVQRKMLRSPFHLSTQFA
jgi:hypothetical protein